MNKGNYISDWTNRITINYAQQFSREPFYGLYGDIHNLCIHTAIKDVKYNTALPVTAEEVIAVFCIKTRTLG